MEANILFDLYNEAHKEMNRVNSEIFTLFSAIIRPLLDANDFNGAREKLQNINMPECQAKFDLIRTIRAAENVFINP